MLRDEDGMVPHGGLTTVVYRVSRRHPFGDEIHGVLTNDREPFLFGVRAFPVTEPEPGTEP